MSLTDLLNRANEIAPVPDENGTRDEWMRHYAAQAAAAWAAFYQAIHEPMTGEGRPELGYLSLVATSSVAAVLGLDSPADDLPRLLWEYTPEAGALNGEWDHYIALVLDRLGINPADLDDRYDARHFSSPSRKAVA